jgi:spermidine/putrescine ABC transporter ATP-binding subunit
MSGQSVESATPDKIAVSVRNLSKSFGDTPVLNGVSVDIRDGEFFSLLGASGCGKTTLLRIIGGFEQPTSGDVLIGGRNVRGDPPYRRRTNMIFQHLALFPHLTVAANIAFGLEMKKTPRDIIREKVSNALDLVRLPGFANRDVNALSGGQKQRIALARALVNEPDVLLLDEPLGALDLRLRLQMQDELRRLHQATRKTFIFVTHDQTEAMTMSDRIAVMSDGEILQLGTPRQVYEQPTRKFVAQFLGSSNFIAGKVTQVRADASVEVASGASKLVCRVRGQPAIGQEVAVLLRYERVEILSAKDSAQAEDLEGKLVSEIFMGSTVRYEVAVDGGISLISEMSNSGKAPDFAHGERVRVRWPMSSAIVLLD